MIGLGRYCHWNSLDILLGKHSPAPSPHPWLPCTIILIGPFPIWDKPESFIMQWMGPTRIKEAHQDADSCFPGIMAEKETGHVGCWNALVLLELHPMARAHVAHAHGLCAWMMPCMHAGMYVSNPYAESVMVMIMMMMIWWWCWWMWINGDEWWHHDPTSPKADAWAWLAYTGMNSPLIYIYIYIYILRLYLVFWK